MGWFEDLQELLGDTAGQVGRDLYSSDSLPINELVEGNWGGAATAPVSAFNNLMAYPLDTVKGAVGTALATPTTAKQILGMELDAGDRARIARQKADAEGGLLGSNIVGRSEWENFIQDKPGPIQFGLEVALDPTNWVGIGAAKGGVSAMRTAAELEQNAGRAASIGRSADAAGSLDFIFNQVPDRLASPVTSRVGGAAKKVIKRVAPNALDFSPQTRVNRRGGDAGLAFDELLGAAERKPRYLPAVVSNATKSLAPLTEYGTVPPFFAERAEGVVPKSLQGRAYDSWLRLQQKAMSNPDIPGVNVPGMGPNAPWLENKPLPLNSFRSRTGPQNATLQDPSVLQRIGKRLLGTDQLGIIKPPAGGYATPDDVRIDEENLLDMATIGAMAMLDFDNDVNNKMFAGLLRSSEGMKKVKADIVKEYGPGIEPFLPASWEQMKQIVNDKTGKNTMPASRFLTAWGWPEGEVPTARLNKIQAMVDDGKITKDQAYALMIGKEFRKASPEAFETAAGYGGAVYASYAPDMSGPQAREMFDGLTGTMRPTTQAPAEVGGRAVVPEDFTNFANEQVDATDTYFGQFADNREAYNHYMRSVFGDLDDQELEVLRTASIEVYYDEVINAASQVSGGNAGATRFLTHGPEVPVTKTRVKKDKVTKQPILDEAGNEVLEEYESTNYAGDSFQKIGIEGETPGDIGLEYQRFATDPNIRSDQVGRGLYGSMAEADYKRLTGESDLTVERYNELTGRKIKNFPVDKKDGVRRPEGKHYVEALTAVGGTPIRDNPKGGPLANLAKIVSMYNAGAELPVGDTVAADWYGNAVKEVMNIVGPGNYEDALMMIDLMAVTSAGTDVETNAANTLKAFSEWKFGRDDFIRNGLGLSKEEADKILLNRSGKWTDPNQLFRYRINEGQQKGITEAFTHYVNKHLQEDQSWKPLQGGPKTNNYAGSFVYKLMQDSIRLATKDNPGLGEEVAKALDKAATIWTEDRHMSRISNLATGVSEMGAIINRERGIMASQMVPVRGEDMQAAIWYYSKDRQGFRRVGRNDDMAVALRQAWNDRVSPETKAIVREKVRELIPDATEQEIAQQADDFMRQEVQIAFISDQLRKNKGKVRKILGNSDGRNALEKLWNLSDDSLGIINRAAQGVPPRRRVSSGIANMAAIASQELGEINSGKSWGKTYRWDDVDGQFVPEDIPSGFAVALTSAGRAVSTGRNKTSAREIERFLTQWSEALDDPTVSEHVKFGLFPMDTNKTASFDLTIIVPDEQVAVDLARRANQKAVYDIGGDRLIDTGGDGTPVFTKPSEIKDIITDLFGETATQKKTLREVRSRGVTLSELDTVNPVSILNRRVVQPILKQYQELSEAALRNAPDPTQTPGGGQMVPSGAADPTTPVDFAAIGQNPLVSTQGNQVLNQPLKDGRTVGQAMQNYYGEAAADIAMLDDAGVMWGPDASLKERLDIIGDNPTLRKLVEQYHKKGIDIRYADPRAVANHLIRRDFSAEEGIEHTQESLGQLFRAAWGEQALFSPKYHLGNIQGAWIQNALAGHFGAGSPFEYMASWKITRGGLDEVTRKEALKNLKAYQIGQKWGFEELPQYLSRGGARAMTSSSRVSGSAVGELTSRLTKNERLGRAVGRPFVANADMSQAIETVMRGTLWGDVLDREMTGAMVAIEDSINTMAERQGLERFEFSILNNINVPRIPDGGALTPAVLKEHLMSLGLTEGYAERAGRNFAEARNISEKVAKKELDRVQFSYDRTNLDEMIGKIIPFHYWMSRAMRYYGEETLRHPQLLYNYMKANDRIEDAQDDPGLTARQKGFLRLMGTPTGFSILMNPDALFGVVKVFGLTDNYTPEGETEAGAVVSWLKARGMGLYPWIDGSLNLMGMYGDTFEPDLLGIRHKALIGSAVNFMRSVVGLEPADAPYQTAMGQARFTVSSIVSQFGPDWLSQPVLPKAGGNTTDATMDTLIESRIISNNPGISNQQLLDAMTDPESPEYQQAFRDVASKGLAQQLLNFTAPQNYRIKDDARDVRAAQVATIYEAAQKQGVSPFEFKPSVGDIEFANTYKRLTGKQWQPGDYLTARNRQDLTRANPEAKEFVFAQIEYEKLGGDENQRIFDKYQEILHGQNPQTVSLSEDGRRQVANLWADKAGYMDNIQYVYRLRESFERTHPEFGNFKGWQDQMYNLSAQLGGSLAEYRRQAVANNPNAAKYFAETERYVTENFPEEEWAAQLERYTTSADAYVAITGQPSMRNDAAPTPGYPTGGDFVGSAMTPAQQYPEPQPQWVSALNQVDQGFGMDTYGTWWNQ